MIKKSDYIIKDFLETNPDANKIYDLIYYGEENLMVGLYTAKHSLSHREYLYILHDNIYHIKSYFGTKFQGIQTSKEEKEFLEYATIDIPELIWFAQRPNINDFTIEMFFKSISYKFYTEGYTHDYINGKVINKSFYSYYYGSIVPEYKENILDYICYNYKLGRIQVLMLAKRISLHDILAIIHAQNSVQLFKDKDFYFMLENYLQRSVKDSYVLKLLNAFAKYPYLRRIFSEKTYQYLIDNNIFDEKSWNFMFQLMSYKTVTEYCYGNTLFEESAFDYAKNFNEFIEELKYSSVKRSAISKIVAIFTKFASDINQNNFKYKINIDKNKAVVSTSKPLRKTRFEIEKRYWLDKNIIVNDMKKIRKKNKYVTFK